MQGVVIMKLTLSISKKECDLIHEQSLKLLKTMGITVFSKEALDVFRKAGARVQGKQVFIDSHLIEESIKLVPRAFPIYSSSRRVVVGKGEICTLPPYGGTTVSRNEQIALGTRNDYLNFTKLNQLNDNISMACPYTVEPFDIPLDQRNSYRIAMILKYSDKPSLSVVGGKEDSRRCIEMVQKYHGIRNKPVVLGNVNVSSPMIMGHSTTEVITVHCEENQPLMIACGSGLSGLTAPPTPGGNLLLANAGVLAGIVFAQIQSPGLPIIYGLPLFGVDPFKAETSVGSSATGLFTLAAKGMAQYYQIPFRAGGTFTDSKYLDYQSGFESGMNLLSSLLAEVDCLMHSFGMEDTLRTINYNKYILDEYMYLSLKDFLKGMDINDVTVMTDEILRAGSTGNYISSRNLKLIRKQYPKRGFGEGKTREEMLKETDEEIKRRLNSFEFSAPTKDQIKILRGYLPDEYID
ncbi:hypothetical protein DOZ58_17615 [Acetobacterium sp. KB-1]|jgi:trimethylamine--corrinoid protein Co-methyltransferase|nr:hypothetical protein DOZ58_17615 [Acetobacterium sp. KB-1]